MFTTGSKWFFGLAAFAFVAALVYGGATNPSEVGMSTFTGVLTLGYKGGVGDHFGYSVLHRHRRRQPLPRRLPRPPSATPRSRPRRPCSRPRPSPRSSAPAQGSYWPVRRGLRRRRRRRSAWPPTQLLVVLGPGRSSPSSPSSGPSRAWAEKATGDPERQPGHPPPGHDAVEVPVLGALGHRRVRPGRCPGSCWPCPVGTYLVFGLVPVAVLVVAFVLSARPRINRSVVAGLCVVGALAVLAGGVLSAIAGPREIEEHHEEEDAHEACPDAAARCPRSPSSIRGATDERAPAATPRSLHVRPPSGPSRRACAGHRWSSLAACASECPPGHLQARGPQYAQAIQNLITPVFAIAGVVFVAGAGRRAVHRRQVPGPRRRATPTTCPAQIHGNNTLEIGWTILPAVILLGVGVLTVITIFELTRSRPTTP